VLRIKSGVLHNRRPVASSRNSLGQPAFQSFQQMKMTPKEKTTRIDLGLAILSATRPGERLSCAEIAAYCDCTSGRIQQIERKALARLRRELAKQPGNA
jgi:DNA-directed RNA polymerase sigma subunit (sigma70/sigma32)